MKKKVKLLYVGRRLTTDYKLYQAFLHGKDMRLFTKVVGVSIGSYYEAQAVGKGFTIARIPKSVDGKEATEAQIRQWEIDEAVDVAEHGQIQAAKRFRKDPKYLEALKPLMELVKGMGYRDKKALIDYIFTKF